MKKDDFIIHSDDSAIILVEFQKTWTEKGFFYRLIRGEYESRNVLSNTLALLDAARSSGVEIVHAPLVLDKGDKARYKKIPFPPKLFKRFTKGTWKAEFTPGVYMRSDTIVTGRSAFDATVDSNLEEILLRGKKKNLLFCGFTTDHCVDETMETLRGKGYHCILVSDCTAAINHKGQKMTEDKYISLTSQEIIGLLKK